MFISFIVHLNFVHPWKHTLYNYSSVKMIRFSLSTVHKTIAIDVTIWLSKLTPFASKNFIIPMF